MAKRDDSLTDEAEKRLGELPDPPTPKRLRKVPGVVNATDFAVIERAVTLQLASIADMDIETAEKTGHALAEVCRVYLVGERSLRHAYESAREQGGKGGA